MTQIIDISTWNGAVDFEKVKAAGIEGVILRAGFGNGTLDNEFIGNINRAIDAEMKYIGAYWFGYAFSADMAVKEAIECDKILEKYKDWLNLGVFYDWEYDSENYAKKHRVTPTRDLVTIMNKAFCNKITELGYVAGYYLNYDYSTRLIDESQLTTYRRWFASWGDIKPDAFIWQYAEDGKISGLSGNFDMNYLLEEVPNEEPSEGPTPPNEPTKPRTEYNITYRTYSHRFGWLNWVGDGETSGTQGQSTAIEAIQIEGGYAKDILASYKLYLETTGETALAKCGEVSGSEDLGRDAQAILIECNVPIKYRAYCQKKGWTRWTSNGKWAGAKGEGLRLEAVQIKVDKKK